VTGLKTRGKEATDKFWRLHFDGTGFKATLCDLPSHGKITPFQPPNKPVGNPSADIAKLRESIKIIKEAKDGNVLNKSEAEMFYKFIISRLLGIQIKRVLERTLSYETIMDVVLRGMTKTINER